MSRNYNTSLNEPIMEFDDGQYNNEDDLEGEVFVPENKPMKNLFTGKKKNLESIKFGIMENSQPLKSNMIRTSKYTSISFLPLNFWH